MTSHGSVMAKQQSVSMSPDMRSPTPLRVVDGEAASNTPNCVDRDEITRSSDTSRSRSVWHQRLVDAECGLKLVLRQDSTLFVHLFVSSAAVIAGLLLGMSLSQWALISFAICMVLAAELFNGVIKALTHAFAEQLPEEAASVPRMATAGVYMTILGALLSGVLVFADRLLTLFG